MCRCRCADIDKPFAMPIEDIFSISGRGTVVTEESNAARSRPRRSGNRGLSRDAEESGHGRGDVKKLLDEGIAGDNVGLLLRGTEKDDVERGQVVCKPGSITPPHEVQGRSVRVDEGRRRTAHAVLQRLPAAVLLPPPRTSPADMKLPAGRGNGHAGRQREL